jgi:hypothetical protein
MKVIHSLDRIAETIGRHPQTIRRWIENDGFPASRLPSGKWVTTDHLIEQWILARAKLHRDNPDTRPKRYLRKWLGYD